MEQVFKALAHPSRRAVLDSLFQRDGQTLNALCACAGFTRQAMSKHLAVLEAAGLVVTDWRGRDKLHYLNAVPIQEISERWLDKYAARRAGAVTDLKNKLERDNADNA